MAHETRYAKSGDVHIAYQVIGNAASDLVFVMGWVSHLDYFWTDPGFARFLTRLASFSRLILFDKRGTGLSDRVAELPSLEQRMDDVRAVLDAVGSKRPALLGISEGGTMSALVAATYPERTSALILIGCFARRLWAPDYPWGTPLEERSSHLEQMDHDWGGPALLAKRAPSAMGDERFRQWWATYLRMSASPGAAVALTRMNMAIDIRHALPMIRVPTLIIHRTGDLTIPVEASRYMAERIPGAKYVELPGADHLPFVGDQDAILDEIEQFLASVQPARVSDRVLATILVAEITNATEMAVKLGEGRWRETLEALAAQARRAIAQFRGQAMRTTGTGFLAAFDGPARAIHYAGALVEAAWQLGISLRAGLHTGECDLNKDEIAGPAVYLAGQAMAQARANEVLVSQTVRDLVAGSSIEFQDLGTQQFREVPGNWRVSRVIYPQGTPVTTPTAESRTGQSQTRLSRREREVAALIARGLTNRQIAEALVISERTAERHVENILDKLDFHSRAQVAAWVVENNLIS